MRCVHGHGLGYNSIFRPRGVADLVYERTNEGNERLHSILFPLLQSSGPVVCMVWEGVNVVLEGRKMLGATKPADSAMGTIRGDFCIE